MTPTVEEVQTEIADLLGDSDGRIFTTAVCFKGFQRAYRYLRDAMLQDQIPGIIRVVDYTLPANTSTLLPATAGIGNFGELIEISEKGAGIDEDYVPLLEASGLLNGRALGSLGIFEWRDNAFQFYGSLVDRDLRIRYYDSGTPPTTGSVGIDGSLPFLSTYGATTVAPGKGYDDAEIQRMRIQALGPSLDGRGGLLFQLIMPMVRAATRVQRQPKPYGAGGWQWKRQRPPLYIAAPPPDIVVIGGSGGAVTSLPITGSINGENAVFTLATFPQSMMLFRNGLLQYPGVAYVQSGTTVTFTPAYVPQTGDLLLVEAVV